jgi:hydroxybutyrate-dimer hydrolase
VWSAACGRCAREPDVPAVNTLPTGLTQQGIGTYAATAVGTGDTAATQDLLTAGLGRAGLGAAAAPTYANPLAPTALELRRNAIYSNYRGLVDASANGGYGTLYGPNVDAAGVATTNAGLIPGREYIATLDDGSGRKRVVIAVQIPDSFNQAAPCLVLGPSSGSRGVYGAIATAGEWGLKHGCAVALTDAGKGVGLYDLADDTVNKIDGTRATRADAGALNFFAANITDAVRSAYNAVFPNRLALKQVHSQLNPEKDWGNDTLAAASYALYALNDRYGTATNAVPFTPANTLVIAGSASNGGAAVLRAAELDTAGLIDGVVAGEPVTEMPTTAGYGIQLGGVPVASYGKKLGDFTTYGNIYQPCAALATGAAMAETSIFNYIALTGQTAKAVARCTSLAAKGLVVGADTATQALDALNKLRNYGWTADNDQMHNAHYALGNGPILSAMYPVMYGRFAVTDNVCNTSFAQVDASGAPIAVAAATKAQVFALANGTANGTPATVVYNDSLGGPQFMGAGHLSLDRRAGLRPGQRAVPARAGHRRRRDRRGADGHSHLDAADPGAKHRGAGGHGRGGGERQTAGQADLDRGRPQRRADPGQQQCARLCGLQQAAGRGGQQARLHRGDERPALRFLCVLQRLRHALRAAARVLQPRHGRDVRAPEERRGAAAQPGGARHATRRHPRRGPGHRRGQCAGDQCHAAAGRPDRLCGQLGQCP